MFLVFLLAFCVRDIAAVDTLVDLGYAKYQGTALPNGITQWLGMRYASPASRVDGMRFAAPRDPPANSSVQEANSVNISSFLVLLTPESLES